MPWPMAYFPKLLFCGGPTGVTRVSDLDGIKGNHDFESNVAGRGKSGVMHWTRGGGKPDDDKGYVKPMNTWLPEDTQVGTRQGWHTWDHAQACTLK